MILHCSKAQLFGDVRRQSIAPLPLRWFEKCFAESDSTQALCFWHDLRPSGVQQKQVVPAPERFKGA